MNAGFEAIVPPAGIHRLSSADSGFSWAGDARLPRRVSGVPPAPSGAERERERLLSPRYRRTIATDRRFMNPHSTWA
jgi:hypothetical protein